MVVRLHNSSLDDDNNDKRPFPPSFASWTIRIADGENERLVKMKGDGGERSGQTGVVGDGGTRHANGMRARSGGLMSDQLLTHVAVAHLLFNL